MTESENRLRRINKSQADKMAAMKAEMQVVKSSLAAATVTIARLEGENNEYRRRLGFRDEQRRYIAVSSATARRSTSYQKA